MYQAGHVQGDRTDGGGRRMVYPMGRNFGPSLGGFIVGASFAAVGAYLVMEEGQRVFGSIFGGIGALVALATLYAMFNSLEVMRDAGDKLEVRVQAQSPGVQDLGRLLDFRLPLAGGGAIPLSELVTEVRQEGLGNIRHYDFRRAITVEADLDEAVIDTVKANTVFADKTDADSETDKILAKVSNWLKVLIKETCVPFLVIGIEGKVEVILEANSQLSRLFAVREDLTRFRWEVAEPDTLYDDYANRAKAAA